MTNGKRSLTALGIVVVLTMVGISVRASGLWGGKGLSSALCDQDILEAGFTPWAVMHMMLLTGDQGVLRCGTEDVTCINVLCEDTLFPGPLLERTERGPRVLGKKAIFRHELEDHYGQFWALRAQGLDDHPGTEAGKAWRECGEELLRLERSRGGQEQEWLLILGGLAVRNLEAGVLREQVNLATQRVLGDFLAGKNGPDDSVLACGGMHAMTGIQICMGIDSLDPRLRESCEKVLHTFESEVREYKASDGYVALPSLHFQFGEPTPRDYIRVLGHIVEWWSYAQEGRYDSSAIVLRLKESINDVEGDVASMRLHSKEVGELCHALAAVDRLRRRRSLAR